jgi:tetratricopeptide (TPR) repeat protein
MQNAAGAGGLANVMKRKKPARRNGMKSSSARKTLRIACIAAAATFVWASISRAQITDQNQMGLGHTSGGLQDQLYVGTADLQAEKEQAGAYQAFLKESTPARKIQLGNDFLRSYPKSPLAERVDVGLMDVYLAEQDWKNSYRFADYALALQPDDVDVLATVGWTIPHVYTPSDPDADQELNKAERYAKHAIEVLAKIPKPRDMTDTQFAATKATRSFQAHSALGLVYFRREDYDSSAKELEQTTKDNPSPDPTDLFVLGADLQNLHRYSEAAEAFRGCSQIEGALQAPCKQGADSVKAQAAQSKIK